MIPIDSAWKLYLATRLHFLKGFDAIKYRGKLNHIEKTLSRPDKVLVRGALTTLDTKRDVVEFCVANFLYENDDFLYSSQDDAMQFFNDWNKYWDSFDYMIKADISSIELSMHKQKFSFEEYMMNGVYKDVLANKIRRETLCVLSFQIPHALIYMQGFGSERFKERILRTIPFIENRLKSVKISIKNELDVQ